MIRTIQISPYHSVQGELQRDWFEPIRRRPLFECEVEHRATVISSNQEFTGTLIPTVKHREIVQ